MKRFLIWLSVVVITVLTFDVVLEYFFDKYIKNNVLPGDYESIDKVLRNNESDILVLGSSVALNSINTKALEDSLAINTFNGGSNGQTFPFILTLLKAAVERHAPKQVILCIQPSMLTTNGLGNRYNFFIPYYGMKISDIDKNMVSIRKHNDCLLNVTSYKLNKIWFRILLYHFITPDIKGENGHIAKPIPPSFPEKQSENLDPMSKERETELQEFLQICAQNNIDLTILFTPLFIEFDNIKDPNKAISQVTELVKPYNVKVYNDIELEPFASDSSLFYDNLHINIRGTEIYTDTIINRIRSVENYVH